MILYNSVAKVVKRISGLELMTLYMRWLSECRGSYPYLMAIQHLKHMKSALFSKSKQITD